MPTLHSTITGADNHEPKGVESAASGTVYVANGSGSGVWTNPSASTISTTSPLLPDNVEDALVAAYASYGVIEGIFDDVSNPSTVLIPVPFDCTIVSIRMILAGPITTANSVVTVTRSDGASMGTQTITFSGSAEGTTFDFVPSMNNVLTGHKYIKLVSDGASSTTSKMYVQALITRT